MKARSRRLSVPQIIGVLVAATLLCVAAIFAVTYLRSLGPATPTPQAETPVNLTEMHARWKSEVLRVTSHLSASSALPEIRQARETILNLRVTADDREAHLKVVMALLALERGDAGAYDSLQAALKEIK